MMLAQNREHFVDVKEECICVQVIRSGIYENMCGLNKLRDKNIKKGIVRCNNKVERVFMQEKTLNHLWSPN